MAEHADITVWIVDDELSVRKLLEFYLKRYFNVIAMTDGKDAVGRLQKGEKPDVIVADMNMPVTGGLELTKYIRTVEALIDVPIIILSGSVLQNEAAKAIEAGALKCLTKPFKPDELLFVIRDSLAQTKKL
ncbi:MAG: response regulator [Balneolia bacterium]|nr:response regulator [Balneolia bacterium]